MPGGNGARLGAVDIDSGGTAAAVWSGWDVGMPPLDVSACRHLLIVAPHPDDETLGLGATAAMMRAAGVGVSVVSVSDGGAAHPGLDVGGRAELESVRREELRHAVRLLAGVEPISFSLPDGELACHQDELAGLLAEVLSGCPAGTWCAATWRCDGHPDHEAVGRAAAAAAARFGDAVFVEYPVWMWHWARPGDRAVPWRRARHVTVTEEARHMKRLAVQSFSSQIRPTEDGYTVLPHTVVERLLTVGEMVFV